MVAGTWLAIISVVLAIGVVIAAPYIKKVTNCYFFWLVVGSLLVAYLICCRFLQQWKDCSDYFNGSFIPFGEYSKSITISRGLLLDICPFVAIFICFSVIVDPTRKTATIVAPFAIYGGLITIVGGISTAEDSSWTFQYIFLGDDLNPMYFMMHLINLIVGVLVLFSSPKLSWKGFIFCNVFAAIYYSYVAIFIFSFKLTNNVSGLVPYDWEFGEYSPVVGVLKLPWQWAMAVGFGFSYGIITAIIFLSTLMQNKIKRYHIINKFNKKTWYLGWYKEK